MDQVEEFFHFISPQIIALAEGWLENTKQTKQKNTKISLDIATEVDFESEKLIKKELNKWFPHDKIIAEETSSETSSINEGRVWIIDPICGSANFQNGIKFFATNIALADHGKLIASCVIDHCRGEYIWSCGNHQIHINNKLVSPEKRTKGIMVEVDLSALTGMDAERVDRHIKLTSFLLHHKNYYLSSFCTSLPFPYVALGRIDAYVNGFCKVWDFAAANFLIEQAGGVVTELNGKPWTLSSDNALAARDKKLHKELLDILNS